MSMNWSHAMGAAGILLAGCQGAIGQGSDVASEDATLVGAASLALTQVPSDVQCLRIVASGNKTAVRKVAVTGGSSVLLDLGRLPLGEVVFSANAYDAACDSLPGAVLSYVADPVSATLATGRSVPVKLTFRRNEPVEVDADFLGNVKELAMGGQTSALLMEDGTVWSRGFRAYRGGFDDVRNLVIGTGHGCVIRENNTVWCWGWNASGQAGVDPDILTSVNTPTQVDLSVVAGNEEIIEGYAAGQTTCVRSARGRLYCWGKNTEGQLGNGSTEDSYVPVRAVESNGAIAYYSRFALSEGFACGINSNARVCCTGTDLNGRLGGTGDRVDYPTWTNCINARAREIALGLSHVCVITADDTVACWGVNYYGQLGIGNGSAASATVPTLVPGLENISALSAGKEHTCALRQDGEVFCWGDNTYGQTGAGAAQVSWEPYPVLSGATRIDNGNLYSCAELDDYGIQCWGGNGFSEIHTRDFAPEWNPVPLER